MRINFVTSRWATLLSAFLLVCPYWAPAAEANTSIPLKSIYQNENDLLSCGGSFIELQNGDLVFFNRRQWDLLKTLIDTTASSFKDKFFVYSPETKKGLLKNITVKTDGSGHLVWDAVPVLQGSQERLRLTPSWSRVLKHQWSKGCTITQFAVDKYWRIGDAAILMSNGRFEDFYCQQFNSVVEC